jgi:putative ABC transport system ATP-binding protein
MIETKYLQFAYPGYSPISFPDIHCERGEHALILGPSGSGKTTLLHLLGGILSPTSGEIIIANTAMHKLRGRTLDIFRAKHIGIVFQKSHFIRSISSLQNLLLASHLAGNNVDRKVAINLLDKLAIAGKADQPPHLLSIGEQQRLSIARALINKPEVILADEPSSALDDVNCYKMITLLKQIASDENANLLIVTHDNRIREMISRKIILTEANAPFTA